MGIFQLAAMFRLWLPLLCLQAALLLCANLSPPSTFKTAGAVAAALAPLSGIETDQLSLLAFKHSIAGDPTGALRSWNGSLHYCQWRGVTCSRRHPGRVTALNLSSLSLSGHISPSIANLTFLRMVNLSINQLNGIIPPQLGSLFRLRYLNLGQNVLGGEIPSNLSRCTDVRFIILSNNQLVGEIPIGLGGLPELRYLDVEDNQITGAIPPSLGNLSSDHFHVLKLGTNTLTGGIPRELGRLTNLKYFWVNTNNLSGTVPPTLYNLSNIEIFHVPHNQLSGSLPPDFGIALLNLWWLDMGHNQFGPNIPSSLSNASSLQVLELRDNMFQGTVPGNFGILKELELFSVSENRIEAKEPRDWQFLTSLTNCTNLKRIFVEFNELGGTMPNSIANLSIGLEELLMAANQITGSIPMGIENLRGLMRLSMGGNRLTGSIPSGLGKLSNLAGLQIDINQLSGEIPSELCNLTEMSVLYLESNNLLGSVPACFGQYQHLEELYISDNSLNGSIPQELFTIFTLGILDLSNNQLEGSLPSNIGRLLNLRTLNVSVNSFSGSLPAELGDCQSMEELYLQSNSFEGTIPSSFKNLKSIKVLDFSFNHLTGKIPVFLEECKFLQYINLSFNNFIGEVPKNGVFANASAISLLGNKMVCGGIFVLKLPACASKVEKKRKSSYSPKVTAAVVIGGLCLLSSLCFITYCCWLRKFKRKTPTASYSEIKYKMISYHDLVKATDGFSHNNLIGRGSFGTVYKGVLDGENVVAIKVLNTQRRGASKSFKSECEALRNIRHRNIVKIISICSSIDSAGNDFKAIVFEFFSDGSLEKWLHQEPEVEMRTLDFTQRLNIAADVASALDYLHNHCHSPILHCDLKPSNILLDANMTAHVGDFGLARFIERVSCENLENQDSTIGMKGTIGYVAPEYGLGNPVSTYGDVYSFGILLLELFIAKRPTDNMFKDGLSLPKFVEIALSKQAMDIIDPHLLVLNSEEEALKNAQNNSGLSRERVQGYYVSLMQIGLNCTKESPQERMAMGAIVKEIHLIREAYLKVSSKL